MHLINFVLLALLVFKMKSLEQRQRRIQRGIDRILATLYAPAERIAIFWNGALKEKETMKDNQQVTATLVAVDAKGNPAGPFDAPPAWSMDDQTVASMMVAADGLSATFAALGKLGSTNVSVAGQVGGKSIVGTGVITVVAGDAVSIALQLGTPVDQAPPSA